MNRKDISFDESLSLSESEQEQLQREWNPYGEGYWHTLRAMAERKFRDEFATHPHILGVHGGTYHGGMLIIGVILDLPRGKRLKSIPLKCAGFHVQQFWVSKKAKNT